MAQHNLDNYTRANLIARAESKVRKADSSNITYYPMLVEINDEQAIDQLTNIGCIIYYRRANFLLVEVPYEALETLDYSSFIDIASMAKLSYKMCDVARGYTNVDAAHTGTDDIAGVDGTGVIAGICDIGIDPSHIAFKGKLGMFSKYDEYNAVRSVYAPGSELQTDSNFPTADTGDQTHGTHTSNIMAGARENNKYYGTAPGAELAVSGSNLTDVGLLCGIEDIIAYAKERNKPAVINLSVGSYLGPHDGTDIVNRYIELLGQEAIICFSAGNNGSAQFCYQHDFTADDEQTGSMFDNYKTWNGFNIAGYMDLWSADSSSFEMQFVSYDKVDKQFIYESDWFAGDGDDGIFIVETAQTDELKEHFDDGCYMAASWGLNSHNNRYNITLSYNINPNEVCSESNTSARYVCGWRIRAKKGTHLDAYSDGVMTFFRRHSTPGMSGGNSLCSINNLCCSHSVVAVGSFNSRCYTPLPSGAMQDYGVTTGIVSPWTSYGTLVDGRRLPHFCAPGHIVVSAMSSEYYANNPSETVSAKTTVDGQTYYWNALGGTSMASPHAAGIIALWVEACPSLTVDEAIKVATATANSDYSDISDARWGAGSIDAFAGLQYLYTNGYTNIADASRDDIPVTVVGRRIVSTSPVQIYDTQGRRYVQNSDLTPGIYIVRSATRTHKFAIR